MTDDVSRGRGADNVRTEPAGVVSGTALNADTINGNVYIQPAPSPTPTHPHIGTASIYVATAEGEEKIAHDVIGPLRRAGYVAEGRAITIGESVIDESRQLLRAGSSIIVCATVRAIGTRWTRELINLATVELELQRRVFVVQLEKDADVEHLAAEIDVARFDGNPLSAVNHLLRLLPQCLPPPNSPDSTADTLPNSQHFLEHPTDISRFDVEALSRFRKELRPEVAANLPNALTPWEFLDRFGLLVKGTLTGTGVLLFGLAPTDAVPTAMVKCTRYHGTDRSARYDTTTYEGTIPGQIEAALRFVADRVGRGEKTVPAKAQSAVDYDYPMLAVREIIANALVHRDYATQDTCIHVRLFSDRLEVSSPGTWVARDLPTGSENELADLQGQSAKRNFRLAYALYCVWRFEGDARGIPTAVKDCEVNHSPMPIVRQEQGFVTVELRRRPDEEEPPSPDAVAKPKAIPATLPFNTRDFVGRAEEMDSLSVLLDQDGPAVCVIHGMGGTGKTTLAVLWASRFANQFPDGTLYLDLRGYSSERWLEPAAALTILLTALGVSPQAIPTSVEAQTILYRSLVADRRILMVLDNVRNAEQVRPLLPGGKQAVVITSRDRLTSLTSKGARSIELGPLTDAESKVMLDRLMHDDRTAAEPEAVKRLIELCEGLPLALTIVAARATMIKDSSLDALAHDLWSEHNRLDALITGDPGTDIRSILAWSYRTLRPQAAALFRMLGLHPGPDIGLDAIAALAGVPRQVARVLTNELAQAHLLEMRSHGRYRIHDLLRAYALDLTTHDWTNEDRHATQRRMFDYYLHTAVTAARWLDPSWEPSSPKPSAPSSAIADRAQAVDWFATERATLLLLTTKAAEHRFYEHAWQLPWAIAPFLEQRGLWHEWMTSQETALEAADLTGDPIALARAHHSLASAHSQFGRFTDASVHLQRTLELTRDIGDHAGQAHALLAMSEICERQNRYHEVLTHAQQAWHLFRTSDRPHGAARALSTMGGGHLRLKQYEHALEYFEHAFRMFRELDDRHGVAAVMNQLGSTHHNLDHHDEAIRHHDQALALWRELDDRYNEAVTNAHLGDAYHASGSHETAREFWQRSLTVLRELDDPDAETVRAKLLGPEGMGV